MTKADKAVYPYQLEPGLTKREHFAVLALPVARQETMNLTCIGWDMRAAQIAELAVRIGDALIAELDKERK